jgi:hypothetical protein
VGEGGRGGEGVRGGGEGEAVRGGGAGIPPVRIDTARTTSKQKTDRR